jgi:6-phosphofructokinase
MKAAARPIEHKEEPRAQVNKKQGENAETSEREGGLRRKHWLALHDRTLGHKRRGWRPSKCDHLLAKAVGTQRSLVRECSGMTPGPTVQDETANNSDDSPADGIQGDHADQQECEHHQGSAALTLAVSPCDHNSGNAN